MSQTTRSLESRISSRRKIKKCPRLPYFHYNPELLGRPCKISIKVKISNPSVEFLRVSLMQHSADTFPVYTLPFYLGIRAWSDCQLVCNSYSAQRGWGREQFANPLTTFGRPMKLRNTFKLTLFNMPGGVMGFVDRQLVFEFKHRMNANEINALEIHGNMKVKKIKVQSSVLTL